jgi:hypothetical protein
MPMIAVDAGEKHDDGAGKHRAPVLFVQGITFPE